MQLVMLNPIINLSPARSNTLIENIYLAFSLKFMEKFLKRILSRDFREKI